MVDRSTAPLEMFGEPDDTECPHGIPTGMGVECWECRYDQLKIDYDALEQECGELVEAAALERQISELTRKNCELQEKLDEYENAYKFIMDDKCFNEEKHCACTPILRAKMKELEAENAMLKARLEPIETAHREYKNYPSSAIVKRDAYDGAEGPD